MRRANARVSRTRVVASLGTERGGDARAHGVAGGAPGQARARRRPGRRRRAATQARRARHRRRRRVAAS